MRQRLASLSVTRISRDTILFVGGLAGVLHQTLFEEADRTSLLIVFAAMMGLPAFLGLDEKRKAADKAEEDDE